MHIEQRSRVRDWSDPTSLDQPRWALLAAGGVTALLLFGLGTAQQRLQRSLERPQPVFALQRVVITAERTDALATSSLAASAPSASVVR